MYFNLALICKGHKSIFHRACRLFISFRNGPQHLQTICHFCPVDSFRSNSPVLRPCVIMSDVSSALKVMLLPCYPTCGWVAITALLSLRPVAELTLSPTATGRAALIFPLHVHHGPNKMPTPI